MSVNEVRLLGNLGKKPELKHTKNGKPVINFSIATNRKLKDGTVKTKWTHLEAWGRYAEIVDKFSYKGIQAYVEGSLDEHEWVNEDGTKQHKDIVVVKFIEFTSRKKESSGNVDTQEDFKLDDMPDW